MSDEKKQPEIKKPLIEGYQPSPLEKKGYQPTEGNLDKNNPPTGGSGVQDKKK